MTGTAEQPSETGRPPEETGPAEMTLDEVATVLGRSVPTVRKRLEEFAAVCGKELR